MFIPQAHTPVPYAIDFGTTNTVVACWQENSQRPEVVALAGVSQVLSSDLALIPSLVYVEDAARPQILIGQAVVDKGLENRSGNRLFQTFKRGIGAKIQGFMPELDGVAISFEQVGTWFLEQILGRLYGDGVADSLVLTVPVDSFEAYRRWLTSVCQGWAVEQIYLLDEPTAAALGYDQSQANLILVLDFGGGTIDFSLVRLNSSPESKVGSGFLLKWRNIRPTSPAPSPRVSQVLAKAGLNLGGSDIDQWLLNYFCQTLGLQPSRMLLRLGERLKIALTDTEKAMEFYFDAQSLESYELNLSRAQLATILEEQGWFKQCAGLIEQVLQQGRQQGIQPPDIEAVLLVGGTSQMPLLQDWLLQYFTTEQIFCHNPLTAVALGSLKLLQKQQVSDYIYHSYGVRYWNRRQNCHSWHTVIKAGQPYPMTEPVELTLGASLDNQPSIELLIGELGANSGATEVYFDGDRLLTRLVTTENPVVQTLIDGPGASTIARLDPPGKPGGDRLKVQLWVDENRYLRLTVTDLLTDKILLNNQQVAQLS